MADLARGERIKALREERHLTQPAVADEVGVTLRAYQAWEATGGIRWENAKKLAGFFGVDPQRLWSGDPDATTGPTPDLAAALNGSRDPSNAELAERLDQIERSVNEGLAKLDLLATAIDALIEDDEAPGQARRSKSA